MLLVVHGVVTQLSMHSSRVCPTSMPNSFDELPFCSVGGPEVAKFCSMYMREEVEEGGEYKSGKYGPSLTHAFHRMDERMRSPEGFTQLEAIRRSLEKSEFVRWWWTVPH